MPIVRIDLPEITSRENALAISSAVHNAMAQTFDVLPEDRFQTVTRRAAGEIVCTPEFLGVRHSASVAFVQITCARVRALEMKKALYARIAADVAQERGLAAGDVIVNLVETARDNWSFGNGIAQCAL